MTAGKDVIRSMFPEAEREPQGGAERRERLSGPARPHGAPAASQGGPCPCGSYRPPVETREVTVPCKRTTHAAEGGATQVRRFLKCIKCGAESGIRVIPKVCVLCEHERHSTTQALKEV